MSQTTTTVSTSASASSFPSIPVPLLASFNYYLPPSAGLSAPSTNDLALILGTKDQDTRRLAVHDVRGREDQFLLDGNGFCYVRQKTHLKDEEWDSDDVIEDKYYAEIEGLLKKMFPTLTAVHHLGHILRGSEIRTDFGANASIPTDPAWNKPNRGAAPAPRVHIDFTRRGVHLVLCQAFGDQVANSITSSATTDSKPKRYMTFSIWRPIKRAVRRDPLAICDARSVRAAELVRLPRIYPDGREGENVVVKATATASAGARSDKESGRMGNQDEGVEAGKDECKHKWYWMSEQRPDEILVIKIFDSADCRWEDGLEERVGVSPHASFKLEGSEGESVRESVEIRVVVCL